MPASQHSEPRDNELHAAAEKAARQSPETLRTAVQQITLDALSKGRVDGARIKQVVKSVFEGVTVGLGEKQSDRAALEGAFQGLAQALDKTAQAVRFSAQEAAGRIGNFAHQDLKQTADDMRTLESLFLDSLQSALSNVDAASRVIIEDLIAHGRRSGTAAGGSARDAVVSLEAALAQTVRSSGEAVAKNGAEMGRRLAQVTSGFLAGLAASLDELSRKRD